MNPQPGKPDALLLGRFGRPHHRSTAVGGVVAIVLASLILTGCGSGPANSSGTTSTSAGSSSANTTAVVTTANNAKYGTILVTSEGKTLYTLTNNGAPVACTGSCGHVWPPLLVPAGTSRVTGGNGLTGLGKSASGTVVEYEGYPLFMYSGDTAPGQANGNGIVSNGGTWTVIKVGTQPGTPVTG